MMLQCWNEKPECRPCFSELMMRLQRMLDDSQVSLVFLFFYILSLFL